MKISPLIAKYLQENKSVSLEGFGRFYLENKDMDANVEDGKHQIINPIHYDFLPNIPTDPAFINFIVKETGKIRPLAIADLETFISLAKQLLNISKPFVIEGVGTLIKTTPGNYDFVPGNYEPQKINTDNERDKKLRQAKEVNRESEIRYSKNYEENQKGNKKVLMKKVLGALTLFLLLGGAGWAVYHFILKKGNTNNKTSNASIVTNEKDTSKTAGNTTTVVVPPVVKTAPKPDSLGNISYKVVVRITDSANAYKRYKQLLDYKEKVEFSLYKDTLYKVAILVSSLPQDSARIRAKMQEVYPTTGQQAFIEY